MRLVPGLWTLDEISMSLYFAVLLLRTIEVSA
jgi:hypothetical protein